jgi:hypothetical protein
MKVVCINNITTSKWEEGEIKTDLIIGEIYNVVEDGRTTSYEYYEIETDDPEVYAAFYKKDMFQKLDDWRDDKLNKLGI